jgi:predicted DNA-binding transcriptional regulator AlpA
VSTAKPLPSQCGLSEARQIFLTSAQVRGRYGAISAMALWRWLRDPRMDFPQPIYFGRLRFWRVNDLEEWERNRISNQTALTR